MASGHGWDTLSRAPLLSLPALLGVFASAETYLKRGNPAASVLQLVRVTQAASEEPLKFGLAGADGAAAWAAGGGTAVCADARSFTVVLFDRWLSVLQQTAERLPYKEENWQTVLGVISEGRRKLEGHGFACGPSGGQVEQLVAARLATCRIQAAAGPRTCMQQGTAAADAAAAPFTEQATPAGQQSQQQQQQPAGTATGGRSRRKAAMAAQAAIVAAVEGGEEGGADEDDAGGPLLTAAGRQRRGAAGWLGTAAAAAAVEQRGASPSSDQENVLLPFTAAVAAAGTTPLAASKPGSKPIDSMGPALGPGADGTGLQKQALQPAQPLGGTKRQRL